MTRQVKQHTMAYATDTPLPRARRVEVIPIDQGGERAFYMRDPLAFAPQPLLLGPAGMLVLSHLDGRHTVDQIHDALRKWLPGGDVGVGEIRHVLSRLSEGCYLDDHVAAARIARICEEFENADVRPAWHAGNAYPQDPGELAAMLDSFFAAASSGKAQDGGVQEDPTAQLAAIMCPHIDLRAGGETYTPAFTALSSAAGCATPFELYVILGVAHNGGTEPGKSFAIATRKHYETPFGQVTTDARVIEDWSRRAGRDITQQQWLHRTEHSVEFALLSSMRGRNCRRTRWYLSCLVASIIACEKDGIPWRPPRLRPNLRRCGRRYLPAANVPSTCSAWTWLISDPNSAILSGSMMPRRARVSWPTAICWVTRNDSMRRVSAVRCRQTATVGTWTPSPGCFRSTRFCPAPNATATCSATGRIARRIPVRWSATPAWPSIGRRQHPRAAREPADSPAYRCLPAPPFLPLAYSPIPCYISRAP